MRSIVAATFILTAGIGTAIPLAAQAADLPPRPAPVVVAPPSYWTGCYIGGNIGGSWANADFTGGIASTGTSGSFTGGFQIGCDWQTGPWVFGIRNMANWTDIHGDTTFGAPFAGATANLRLRWFDHLTGRIGYTMAPNWLLYGQGGVAFSHATLSAANAAGVSLGTASTTRTGWTVGLGAEYMWAPGWSAFLEYNYANYGRASGAFTTVGNVSAKVETHNVLLGLNWRWGAAWGPGRI